MAHVVPDLPSTKASQALFSTYYLALVDDYDPIYDPADVTDETFRDAEMTAALALVPRASVTKLFAVDSGNWNTAGNWYPSGVPGAGTEVCIPEGTVCTYDLDAPSTGLNWLRIDGTLKTDQTVDTAMLFDTMVVTQLGLLQDGTRAQRVDSAKTHEWLIAASNGLIDVTWDTFFQSRGILSLGQVDMWGAYKTNFLEVASYAAPVAAATSLTLESTPTNWAVGDDIVITSTVESSRSTIGGLEGRFPQQDEKRTLTSQSGTSCGWTSGLTYSHAGPQGTLSRTDCKAYVANLTRNIVIKPDTTSAPAHHRGHLMQMHNPAGWSMRDVEIADLGRTHKLEGLTGIILHSSSATTAATPVDLTTTSYWNGSAIVLGPTFLLDFIFTPASSGNLTITGTDEDGAPLVEVIAYTTGQQRITGEDYFLTVTAIEFSTNTSSLIRIAINARSRQLNQNGVRDLHGDLSLVTVTYSTVKNTVNIQGRYAFHWHKLGVRGGIRLAPPVVDNCSFHGTPGWLFAQHQTHGHILNNVFRDAQGAGLVSEDGNESGVWQGNLAIRMIGNDDQTHKDTDNLNNIDPARTGAGFWFTSRLIHTMDNVATGCQGGFIFNARLDVSDSYATDGGHKTAFRGEPLAIAANHFPIGRFDDNKSIACFIGMLVTKSGPDQNHDLRTTLRRFDCWSIANHGMEITYTGHYTMEDCRHMGGYILRFDGVTNITRSEYGFALGPNSYDQVFVNPSVEGCTYGIDLIHATVLGWSGSDANFGRIVVNPTFTDCTNNYKDVTAVDQFLDTVDLNSNPVTLSAAFVLRSGVIYDIEGTKSDEIGTSDFPFGFDTFTYGSDPGSGRIVDALGTYGYYTEGATKWLIMDEWFSSRVTGIPDKVRLYHDVSALSLTGYTNHGATNPANNTAPTIADFSVNVTRNDNLIVDILARASGNTVAFGGFSQPSKTDVRDNGDGTVTLIPLPDQNYSESCYIWVDDINGNTTRAVMTINAYQVITGTYGGLQF